MPAKKRTAKGSAPKKVRFNDRDLKLLWGYAAGRCSRCRGEVIATATAADAAAVVGQNAHIRSYRKRGPRYESTYPVKQLHRYENLILLCPNHHGPVDQQWRTYSVQELEGWKAAHEQWVREQLRACMPGIGFAELEVVAKALLGAGVVPNADYDLLDVSSKMAKNGLSQNVRFDLSIGLSKAKEVEDYVVHVSARDPAFAERLRAGFLDEYRRQRNAGLDGDALFAALAEFASGGRRDFRSQAAGRIVLAYLFEKCEVFEK
jgi:hypothetical protein